MKIALILFPIFLFFSCKKETINPGLVKQFTISSSETGNAYDISVQLPDDYSTSAKSYATMYVLDAKQDDAFVGVKCDKISKALSTQNVIVVGIRYQNNDDRDIDYTPTETSYGKGGSHAFLQFIKTELIPRIQSDYHVDTFRSTRTIIGHSFGGLLGAYVFTKHNEVFGNYLLLSPSLFYDNSIILKYEQEKRENIKAKSQLVFIAAGSTEKDLLPANDLLFQRLGKFYPSTKTSFELASGLGHLSSKNTNIEKAIIFYFKNR